MNYNVCGTAADSAGKQGIATELRWGLCGLLHNQQLWRWLMMAHSSREGDTQMGKIQALCKCVPTYWKKWKITMASSSGDC